MNETNKRKALFVCIGKRLTHLQGEDAPKLCYHFHEIEDGGKGADSFTIKEGKAWIFRNVKNPLGAVFSIDVNDAERQFIGVQDFIGVWKDAKDVATWSVKQYADARQSKIENAVKRIEELACLDSLRDLYRTAKRNERGAILAAVISYMQS